MSDIDKWIDIAKECKYLPENDLKVKKNVRNLFLNHYNFSHGRPSRRHRSRRCNDN